MRKLFILLGVVLVLTAGAVGYWKFWRSAKEEVKYRTVTVDRGEIMTLVNSSGTINPLVKVDLGSQVSGIVQRLSVDFNNSVKAGQLVAEIDPSTYVAQVTQAEANVARAHADWLSAEIALKRARQLAESKIGTQNDVDLAQARFDMTAAVEKQERAALDQSQTNLRNTKIYSPIDGIVIDRKVEVGQTVAAGLNVAVIYTIANDLAKMQIDTLVDEADIGRVVEGQEAEFHVDAFPHDLFHGKVTQVRNAAINKQDVINYDVVVLLDNSERKLKPGMTANVSIVVAHKTGVLRIPNAALRFKPPPKEPGDSLAEKLPHKKAKGKGSHGDKVENQVYWVVQGEPKPVPVEIGIQDESYSEVISGLENGQSVIEGVEFGKGATVPGGATSNPWGMRRF